MEQPNLNQFKKEVTCTYRNETYSARDNGAVFRHRGIGSRFRRLDENWTFGKPNNQTGYMEIASVRIHRIVAIAFHGEPPTKEHVVDHKDTNKRNNRPENLRWVTRLENVLLNPITVKRIELTCGCPIEEFLADPSKFRDKFQEPNYKWMCTVSKEEALECRRRLLAWAESDKIPSGGSIGEWIYNPGLQNQYVDEVSEFTASLTQNAKQKNWSTPSEFPCCPQETTDKPLATYASNLKVGRIFSQNQYSKSITVDLALAPLEDTLWVVCKSSDDNAVKPWSLAEVTYENNLFVHANLGSFFIENGAYQRLNLVQGLEWDGGETFDDLVS